MPLQKEIHKAEEWSRRKEFWRQNVLPFCVGLFICAIGYLQLRTSWIVPHLAAALLPPRDGLNKSRNTSQLNFQSSWYIALQWFCESLSRRVPSSPLLHIARLLETGWLHIIITVLADLLFETQHNRIYLSIFSTTHGWLSSQPKYQFVWLQLHFGPKLACSCDKTSLSNHFGFANLATGFNYYPWINEEKWCKLHPVWVLSR